MITIVNKYTGELVCKYSNASKQYADKDSFIANVKGSKAFRRRFGAIVFNFHYLTGAVQCTLNDQYAVLEMLTAEDKLYWGCED